MTKEKRNWLIVLGIFALPFLIFLGCLISGLTSPNSATIPPLPNPNGYDTFVAAGKLIVVQPGLFETMNEEELTSLINSNSQALALLTSAFSNASRVPVQYSVAALSTHTPELVAFRELAQTLAAQGRLAELKNNFNAAAQTYLEIIHFGNEAGRGGILIDAMIGIAIQNLGQLHLTNLVTKLDAKSCREVAATLEVFDATHQTWSDVLDQEDLWRRRVMPGLKNYFVYLVMYKQTAEVKNKSQKIFKEQQKQLRYLMIQFAARAYELDKGKSPTNISDLVPNYLKAIPQNPFTGTNMNLPLK